MLGWADMWSRVAEAEGLSLNTEPLRRIARKLAAVSPLTLEDVVAGRASLMATHRAFLDLPVAAIKAHARTCEIAFALEPFCGVHHG